MHNVAANNNRQKHLTQTYNEIETYKTSNYASNGRINAAKESRHTAIQHSFTRCAQHRGA
jgi:hypothetical protein